MSKLWAIIQREYMERVRTRWFLIATVFGPALFGLLLYLPAYLATRSRVSTDVSRIRVLDATRSAIGSRVAAELNGGPAGDTTRTQVVRLQDSIQLAAAESIATKNVIDRQLKGYLVFRLSSTGIRARYAGRNASSLADMNELESAVRRAMVSARLEAAGISPGDARSIAETRFKLEADRITSSGRGGSGEVNILFAFTVSLLLYLTIFIYGQNVLRGVMEEKQTRVAEVVMSSVNPTSLLAGKVLGVGAVGLTQITIWMAAAYAMYHLRVRVLAQFGIATAPVVLPSIGWGVAAVLLLFFVLGYTFYAALFAAVGALVSSEQEAQQAQFPVIMLLVASVLVLQPAMNAPDGRLAMSMSWLPFSAPIVMPLRMSSVTVPWWEVTLSIVSLLAACYVATWFAARVYRVGLLMYGKRPTLREIAHWVVRAQ